MRRELVKDVVLMGGHTSGVENVNAPTEDADAVALSAEDGLRLRDGRYEPVIENYYDSDEIKKKKRVEKISLVILKIPGFVTLTKKAASVARR